MTIQVKSDAEPIEIEADAYLPTEYGNFRVMLPWMRPERSTAPVHGRLCPVLNPLVRIHSECLTGDAFGSMKCDCGPQLKTAMKNQRLDAGQLYT